MNCTLSVETSGMTTADLGRGIGNKAMADKKICRIGDCEKEIFTIGLCMKHYMISRRGQRIYNRLDNFNALEIKKNGGINVLRTCPITNGNKTLMLRAAFKQLCLKKQKQKRAFEGRVGNIKTGVPLNPVCKTCDIGQRVRDGKMIYSTKILRLFNRKKDLLEWSADGKTGRWWK